MCGDLDEDTHLDDELFAWLVANAKAHGAVFEGPAGASTRPMPEEAGSAAWMSLQFGAALSRALSDVAAAPEGGRAGAVAGEAIVLARLAGFLAGHVPAESDIFRNLVDALLDGYREPEQRVADQRAPRAHGGGHRHGHDH